MDGSTANLLRRFLQRAPDALTDEELLTLLLHAGTGAEEPRTLAARLIGQFGSLGAALSASPEELASVEGMDASRALLLRLVTELHRRYYLSRPFSGARLTGTTDFGNFLLPFFYGAREELLAANAGATAEGAIGVLLGETERTLWRSRVLITGWGHVGRTLAARLKTLGAEVCVLARSPGTRAWIEAEGLECADAAEPSAALAGRDIVINTVPAPMLTASRIAELGARTLILDLASAPGGTDFDAARAFGIRALTAPGLPGKWSPQTAAEAVRDAVYNILEDEKA